MDDGAQIEPAGWDLAAPPIPDFEVDQRRFTVDFSPEVPSLRCRDGSNCTGQRLSNHKARTMLARMRLNFLSVAVCSGDL